MQGANPCSDKKVGSIPTRLQRSGEKRCGSIPWNGIGKPKLHKGELFSRPL